MMKKLLLTALLTLAAAAPGTAAPQTPDPMFGPRTLYGWGPWLASFDGAPALGVTEVVALFAEGRKPGRATITAITPQGAAAYARAGLLVRGPDAPPRIVAIAGEVPKDEPVMAVRALAPFHKLIGSAPVPAGAGEPVARLLAAARLQLGKQTLVYAHRYQAPRQPEIVDLFLGEPTWNRGGKTMRSVAIQRLTFVGGKLLVTKVFKRRGGVEERVDTEPVTLTRSAWAETSRRTLGFVGLPDGRWFRLTADVGFEGIGYRVEEVGSGAVAYDAYHYLPH